MTLKEIKIDLYQKCQEYVDQRIETFRKAMQSAQESANNEVKSSAGDKYETGRAMMQIEKDQNAVQLSQVLKLKQVLDQLQPEKAHQIVELGSLVLTNNGNFYFAVPAGKFEIGQKDYYAISPSAPLGLSLAKLKVGQKVKFNGREYQVLDIA
jgi:transcription elongation GreA/GreB family factor